MSSKGAAAAPGLGSEGMDVTTPDAAIVVMVSVDDAAAARELARDMVDARLVACAQMLPMESCYRWEGETHVEAEQLMLLKTLRSAYPALERWIVEHHDYEVPEILAVRVEDGLPAYLAWIGESVSI